MTDYLNETYNPDEYGNIKPGTYQVGYEHHYVSVCQGEKATLDGDFTIEELEFFIGLMK